MQAMREMIFECILDCKLHRMIKRNARPYIAIQESDTNVNLNMSFVFRLVSHFYGPFTMDVENDSAISTLDLENATTLSVSIFSSRTVSADWSNVHQTHTSDLPSVVSMIKNITLTI